VTLVAAGLHNRPLKEPRLRRCLQVRAMAVRAAVARVPVGGRIVKGLLYLRILPSVRVALQTGTIPQRVA